MEPRTSQLDSIRNHLENVKVGKINPKKFVQDYRAWIKTMKLHAKHRGKAITENKSCRENAYQMYLELVTGQLEYNAILNVILTDDRSWHYTNPDRDRRSTDLRLLAGSLYDDAFDSKDPFFVEAEHKPGRKRFQHITNKPGSLPAITECCSSQPQSATSKNNNTPSSKKLGKRTTTQTPQNTLSNHSIPSPAVGIVEIVAATITALENLRSNASIPEISKPLSTNLTLAGTEAPNVTEVNPQDLAPPTPTQPIVLQNSSSQSSSKNKHANNQKNILDRNKTKPLPLASTSTNQPKNNSTLLISPAAEINSTIPSNSKQQANKQNTQPDFQSPPIIKKLSSKTSSSKTPKSEKRARLASTPPPVKDKSNKKTLTKAAQKYFPVEQPPPNSKQAKRQRLSANCEKFQNELPKASTSYDKDAVAIKIHGPNNKEKSKTLPRSTSKSKTLRTFDMFS